MTQSAESPSAIAIIAMSGRFPGARDVAELWQVIREGRDTILRFAPDPQEALEPDAEELRADNYVRARGVLTGVEDCDTEFFEFTPAEAAGTDPQQRLWLEVAWEALEAAGYAREGHDQVVGVFAGSFTNTYLLHNLLPDRTSVEEFVRLRRARSFAMLVQNDPAFLSTRTAYKLDLRGPAVNVQSACSTSLVAIATAVRALLSYDVDIALAGGVCIATPQRSGYFYQEGAIQSKDGTCRPYDAAACGTVFGNGAAAVVLKRLDDARRDGDPIRAIILGAAINNDGHNKVSFAAPSVTGQASVIVAAQALAGVDADTIEYVEGHGTATPMGDPIEVQALTRAFRQQTTRKAFCALGSLKGNVGHLDAAAGAAGLIRAVLALENRVLPPTAHFQTPNPELRLSETPFFVCSEATPWNAREDHPRRAAVSSFGIGGTNAHVILEEAAPIALAPRPPAHEEPVVLLLSAKGPEALEHNTRNLAAWMEAQIAEGRAPRPLADVAHVLARRRKVFPHRRVVCARSWQDAAGALATPARWTTGRAVSGTPKVFFVFPGQGGLRPGALARIASADGLFKAHLETVAGAASAELGFDLVRWFTDPDADMTPMRQDNAKAQLAIFSVDLALARWLEDHGVRADGFVGHSLGEWVAAQIAGVVDLESAVRAVHERGRLMQSTGKGAALIVRISEHGALRYAVEPVALACVNGPELVLLTGPEGAIAETERRLAADGVAYKRPPIDVAVHSSCMDAILPAFREALAGLTLQPATRPILSTVFAEWLEPAHAAERDYWAAQIRKPVHFDRAGQRLFEAPCCVVLEVGLGAALSGLLAGKRADKLQQRALAALGPLEEGGVYPEDRLERCLAELWANGVPVDLAGGAAAPESAPILPAYAFQRQRCWIDAPEPAARGAEGKRAPAPPSPEVAGRAAMAPAQLAVMHAISQLSRLPLAKLDPSTTFMEMGLDSLFLAQLAEALRASTGVTLTLADLVRDNTIERVALLLGARAEAMKGVAAPVSRAMPQALPSQLVQLRAGDPHNPVLFIHGDAADRFLPPYLPRGQSLYGYLHQGADGGRIQHTRVEDLAAQCHQEWLQICGEEPCVLGGHSFGGLVAYHVAHLRRKAGLPVSLVVMIDTHHPITFRNADRLDPRRPRRWLQEMRVAARRHRDRAHAEALLLLGKTIPPELRPDYHMAVYDSAARLYEPPPLEVDVLFFHADAGFYGRADRYWDAVVRGRLEVHPSRADHLTIVRVPETFDPVARILAERLASLHSRVEEARGGRTAPAPTM